VRRIDRFRQGWLDQSGHFSNLHHLCAGQASLAANGAASFSSACQDSAMNTLPPSSDGGRSLPRSAVVEAKLRDEFSLSPMKELWETLKGFSEQTPGRSDSDSLRDSYERYAQGERDRVVRSLEAFFADGEVIDAAREHLFVNQELMEVAKDQFIRHVVRGIPRNLYRALVHKHFTEQELKMQILFPLFGEYVNSEFSEQLKQYRDLVSSADLRMPHKFYPLARMTKRKFIYHVGPTNSGKTYNAIQAFKRAETGVYCAPLRLLAMEVYDACNMDGTYCNLLTGQEKKIVPFAKHVACTVEIANLENPVEVAVVDEIQMIGDRARGWAWTRAIHGLPAKEIHLCGDNSALEVVKAICEEMEEELEVMEYKRLTPLSIEEQGMKADFSKIQRGDCVVAFSRKNIYLLKQLIEEQTDNRCCVIYGALPPETRKQQARKFNEIDGEHGVLVASDAIGMGLNLNIRRVVFTTLEKFHGDSNGVELMAATQVKQISGRAGRRSSIYKDDGKVTCLFDEDLPQLRTFMESELRPLSAAGVLPSYEQFELFAAQLPGLSFYELLHQFMDYSRIDNKFFLCRVDELKKVALLLERFPSLSLRDRFFMSFAPVNTRSPEQMAFLLKCAEAYAMNYPADLKVKLPKSDADGPSALHLLEEAHKIITLYLWLATRFSERIFVHALRGEDMLRDIISRSDRILTQRMKYAASLKGKETDASKDASKKKAMISMLRPSSGAP